jgi:hypothetical protein
VRIVEPTKADLEATRIEWAEQFPGARFGCFWDISPSVLDALHAALANGSEEAIQKVLTANPYLIQYAVARSGHHGIWVFPKQMIRPPGADRTNGLIPDYLVVTRSSLGYFWYVVELKRFNVQFARVDGRGLSQEGNKAIAQCNGYLAHIRDYIETVRRNICIDELIQPQGAVLLIGDSETENEKQRKCRADFVRASLEIDVVSYRRIVDSLKSDLRGRLSAG